MKITVLKSKIHRATVTEADLNYEGSISIDLDLMESAGIREFEKVLIANLNNGKRYETYVIKADKGSQKIGVNGAGALYSKVGDKIIIMSFAEIVPDDDLIPKIVLLNDSNEVIK